jgi:hypothetical protein
MDTFLSSDKIPGQTTGVLNIIIDEKNFTGLRTSKIATIAMIGINRQHHFTLLLKCGYL